MLKQFALLLAFVLVRVPGLAQALDQDQRDAIEQRRQLVESGSYLQAPQQGLVAASASSLAEAMDIDPSLLADASAGGAADGLGVLASLGTIRPLRGASFAVLSSGQVATVSEPGTDFLPEGVDGDTASLVLTLTVPPGQGRLSFAFNFLSAEFPEFIGLGFDDTFTVSLQDVQGERIIASANVDSAPFFPASASRAAGSGFDLFTADPTGVDDQFGTVGSPDAGLTDFISVNVPFESSGQIVLRFFIADAGDGILDSAAILDALTVSSLEVVDVVPDFFKSGSFVTDPAVLATKGRHRQGAAADGVTRLLVRSRVAGPGTVVFSLENGSAPQDGGFAGVGGNQRAASVSVPTVQTAAGHMAFAVYRTPDEFNRGSDAAAVERTVVFKATFTPSGGGAAAESRLPIKLVRPPLVFIHGLWSGPSTWKFPLVQDARFPGREIADYRGTNASHFATNAEVSKKHIRRALEQLRERQIAATQVDLIGHSMGGLLGRIWVAAGGSKHDDNFNAGEIRKLLTLDTPHTGSPLANLLLTLQESFLLGNAVKALFRHFDHPIDEGAIEDMAKGSAAIAGIPAAPVPAHAFVGTGGSDVLAEVPGVLGDFYAIVNLFANITGSDLFEGFQHDGIVGRLSQQGGLPDSARTAIGGLDGLHVGVPPLIPGNTASGLYSAGLSDLLDAPVNGGKFAQFPAPSAIQGPSTAMLEKAMQAKLRTFKAVAPGLTITSPPPGIVVSPGQLLAVTVEPFANVNVTRVLVTGPSAAQVDESPPFELSISVPAEAIGEFTLMAAGTDDQGNLFTSGEVTLLAQPAAALTLLELFPKDPILLGPGDTVHLTALGHFSDGVVRDLSDPALGTVFSSVEPDIAEVSADGLVTAQRPGVTTLLARLGGVQDSVTVNILPGQEGFFTLTPCRIFDSRDFDGPFGGPILQSGVPRTLDVSGVCGIPPSGVAALSLNVTVVAPNGPGFVILQPAGLSVGTSTINFSAGQIRANNAVVQLNGEGELSIVPFVAAVDGTTHVLLDVNGYFQPEP